jgi:hypothetical protein
MEMSSHATLSKIEGLELVAHPLGLQLVACHPSYSGGRDQEDLSSTPALGK